MKGIVIILSTLFISGLNLCAQDQIKVELKDDPQLDVYIDGKKYDHDIFDLLDQSKIESVNVFKGKKAMEKYQSPNGVIVITTKKAAKESEDKEKIVIKDKDGDKNPVFIIDGKASNKQKLEKISPDDIESIEVVKGQKAIDKYDAPNGVIIIKTKKN